MTNDEFYQHFESLKVIEQQKILLKLAKIYNKKFQEALQKVMHE